MRRAGPARIRDGRLRPARSTAAGRPRHHVRAAYRYSRRDWRTADRAAADPPDPVACHHQQPDLPDAAARRTVALLSVPATRPAAAATRGRAPAGAPASAGTGAGAAAPERDRAAAPERDRAARSRRLYRAGGHARAYRRA